MIAETGLCVWRSGASPVLDIKSTGDFLAGRMAIFHTGYAHDTPGMADGCRNYDRIAQSSLIARAGVMERNIHELAAGVALYHSVQLQEGMAPLPVVGEELAKNIWEADSADMPCICSLPGRTGMPRFASMAA